MTVFFLNLLARFLGFLGHRGIRFLATFLAVLGFDLLRLRRGLVLKNLDIALGPTRTRKEKTRIGRQSVITFLRTVLELIAARRLFPRTRVTYSRPEILEAALAEGRGVYALCLHMGNWEFMCHAGAKRFAPIHVVVKPVGKGAFARWIEDTRKAVGYRIIERKGRLSAAQAIHSALAENKIVAIVVDQKRSRGDIVPFFGRPAPTNNSLVRLWQQKQAPIVPVSVRRVADNHHEVLFFPRFVITEDPGLTPEQNRAQNTERMNALVEKLVLANPEEYFWLHNRWDL